jgi:transposase
MRGHDEQQEGIFSYIPEKRVPVDHALRRVRTMADRALKELSPKFQQMYSHHGRPSIAPEKLLRALVLQALYSVRSERLLMEELNYNLLFRWFVGLNVDDEVWDVTVFTKNRQRLLEGNIAEAFFDAVLAQAEEQKLLSDEHFHRGWDLDRSLGPSTQFSGEERSTLKRQRLQGPEIIAGHA